VGFFTPFGTDIDPGALKVQLKKVALINNKTVVTSAIAKSNFVV
jgi:hypothetical protein